MLRKAVQFGAGNIGRGFTAQLFTESGYEVVFVDVAGDIVNLINERKCYPIRIVDDEVRTVEICNVRAVNGRDIDLVAQELLAADLACTAVGVNALKYIAPALAAGIRLRADANIDEPLNIIICENLLHASDVLCDSVLAQLPPSYDNYVRTHIGFVESSVGRMVPVMTEEQRAEDPLLVNVEAYKILPIDRQAWIGELPSIEGLEPRNNFAGYVERKLYTHNLGHASTAYIGRLKGFEYIYQAIADTDVQRVVRAIMAETGEALIQRWGLDPAEHQAHIDDLIRRFGNKALGDTVARVARDPIRKLGPDDRLIGGAKLALAYEIRPTNICLAIAAALAYDEPGDPSSVEIQSMIKEKGIEGVLETVSRLEPDSIIVEIVMEQADRIRLEDWMNM
jgi:mannitol-1-phosphate 5-dehydrogenase